MVSFKSSPFFQSLPCRIERSVNGPKRLKTAKNGRRYDGQIRSTGKRFDTAKNAGLLGDVFRVVGNDYLLRRTFFTVLHLFYLEIEIWVKYILRHCRSTYCIHFLLFISFSFIIFYCI